MTTQEKANLISAIISKLSFTAEMQKKKFDSGDTFFSLCFKTDEELEQIAKLAGV